MAGTRTSTTAGTSATRMCLFNKWDAPPRLRWGEQTRKLPPTPSVGRGQDEEGTTGTDVKPSHECGIKHTLQVSMKTGFLFL